MATKTWQNGGVDNNYSTAGNWVEGSKPASGDDVVMAAAYNCVVNENTANLRSFNMTGYANTLSGSSNITVVGAAGTTQVCLFAGTITWTGQLILNPPFTANVSLTWGGMTTCTGISVGSGASQGHVYLLDAVSLGSTRVIGLSSGTLHMDGLTDNAGLTHTIGVLQPTGSSTRTLALGNSTINLIGTGTVYNNGTTTLETITTGTSTINISNNSASTKAFSGGGKTYNNLTFSGGGSGALTIGGNNTFNVLTVSKTNSPTLKFSSTSTNIVSNFVATGDVTHTITLAASTGGSAATLTKSGSGTIQGDYLNITDINVTPAATWYYGNNSTWNSGTGWNAGSPGGFLSKFIGSSGSSFRKITDRRKKRK